MKQTIFFVLLLAQSTLFGQKVNVEDNRSLDNRTLLTAGGVPLSSTKYFKIAGGTPYFSDTWMKGTIVTPQKMEFKNLRLKIDLLENIIVFLTPDNEERINTENVDKIILEDTVNHKGYLFVHSSTVDHTSTSKTWYQVLALGPVNLYKENAKNIYEAKPYGSSVTEQTIRDMNRYYVFTNHQFARIKVPADLVSLLSNHKKEVEEYIKSNKLKGKKEEDFQSVVNYYNSLAQ